MAVFNVTNLMDSGAGSLRQAILAANTNLGIADTINFDSSLSGGTIGLTSGELLITDPLTINGLGANNLTVVRTVAIPTPNFRIFDIDDGISGNLIDVFINGLTITGGNSGFNSGGGIANLENLTVANSIISGNSAFLQGGGILSTYSTYPLLISPRSLKELPWINNIILLLTFAQRYD